MNIRIIFDISLNRYMTISNQAIPSVKFNILLKALHLLEQLEVKFNELYFDVDQSKLYVKVPFLEDGNNQLYLLEVIDKGGNHVALKLLPTYEIVDLVTYLNNSYIYNNLLPEIVKSQLIVTLNRLFGTIDGEVKIYQFTNLDRDIYFNLFAFAVSSYSRVSRDFNYQNYDVNVIDQEINFTESCNRLFLVTLAKFAFVLSRLDLFDNEPIGDSLYDSLIIDSNILALDPNLIAINCVSDAYMAYYLLWLFGVLHEALLVKDLKKSLMVNYEFTNALFALELSEGLLTDGDIEALIHFISIGDQDSFDAIIDECLDELRFIIEDYVVNDLVSIFYFKDLFAQTRDVESAGISQKWRYFKYKLSLFKQNLKPAWYTNKVHNAAIEIHQSFTMYNGVPLAPEYVQGTKIFNISGAYLDEELARNLAYEVYQYNIDPSELKDYMFVHDGYCTDGDNKAFFNSFASSYAEISGNAIPDDIKLNMLSWEHADIGGKQSLRKHFIMKPIKVLLGRPVDKGSRIKITNTSRFKIADSRVLQELRSKGYKSNSITLYPDVVKSLLDQGILKETNVSINQSAANPVFETAKSAEPARIWNYRRQKEVEANRSVFGRYIAPDSPAASDIRCALLADITNGPGEFDNINSKLVSRLHNNYNFQVINTATATTDFEKTSVGKILTEIANTQTTDSNNIIDIDNIKNSLIKEANKVTAKDFINSDAFNTISKSALLGGTKAASLSEITQQQLKDQVQMSQLSAGLNNDTTSRSNAVQILKQNYLNGLQNTADLIAKDPKLKDVLQRVAFAESVASTEANAKVFGNSGKQMLYKKYGFNKFAISAIGHTSNVMGVYGLVIATLGAFEIDWKESTILERGVYLLSGLVLLMGAVQIVADLVVALVGKVYIKLASKYSFLLKTAKLQSIARFFERFAVFGDILGLILSIVALVQAFSILSTNASSTYKALVIITAFINFFASIAFLVANFLPPPFNLMLLAVGIALSVTALILGAVIQTFFLDHLSDWQKAKYFWFSLTRQKAKENLLEYQNQVIAGVQSQFEKSSYRRTLEGYPMKVSFGANVESVGSVNVIDNALLLTSSMTWTAIQGIAEHTDSNFTNTNTVYTAEELGGNGSEVKQCFVYRSKEPQYTRNGFNIKLSPLGSDSTLDFSNYNSEDNLIFSINAFDPMIALRIDDTGHIEDGSKISHISNQYMNQDSLINPKFTQIYLPSQGSIIFAFAMDQFNTLSALYVPSADAVGDVDGWLSLAQEPRFYVNHYCLYFKSGAQNSIVFDFSSVKSDAIPDKKLDLAALEAFNFLSPFQEVAWTSDRLHCKMSLYKDDEMISLSDLEVTFYAPSDVEVFTSGHALRLVTNKNTIVHCISQQEQYKDDLVVIINHGVNVVIKEGVATVNLII